MTRWPLWRLLVCIEAWLLSVAAFHRYRPIHEDVIVPLLIGVVPSIALVGLWGLARAAAGERASGEERATVIELIVAATSVAAALVWIVQWTMGAREELERFDEAVGQATIIIDVSLTGLSAAACLAALALDWILSTAHGQLRRAMAWLRRTHVLVTVVYVVALFGSAWLFTHWPDTPGLERSAALFRARAALYVFELAKATAFPVQALFAAMAVVVGAMDSRQARRQVGGSAGRPPGHLLH